MQGNEWNNEQIQPPHSAIRDRRDSWGAKFDTSNFKILANASCTSDLIILESLYVYNTKPILNNQLSSYPLSIVNYVLFFSVFFLFFCVHLCVIFFHFFVFTTIYCFAFTHFNYLLCFRYNMCFITDDGYYPKRYKYTVNTCSLNSIEDKECPENLTNVINIGDYCSVSTELVQWIGPSGYMHGQREGMSLARRTFNSLVTLIIIIKKCCNARLGESYIYPLYTPAPQYQLYRKIEEKRKTVEHKNGASSWRK